MSNYDLANLSGDVITRYDYVSGTYTTDVFEFDLEHDRNINLFLRNTNISSYDDIDLTLFFDSNNNGVLDSGDTQVAASWNPYNQNEVIDYGATAGTYFAQVEAYNFSRYNYGFYDLSLSATLDVGTLSNEVISRDRFSVTTSDPKDVFEFQVAEAGTLSLQLHNIDYGDADLRLYKDSNGNGIFDDSDQEVAASLGPADSDENIAYSAAAGTYFAQVERYSGTRSVVSYDLDFAVDTAPAQMPATYRDFNAAQVFSLNSNASASHTIYLDFDGHITTGTDWNDGLDLPTSFSSAAYDTDGSASFSIRERRAIWEMWQRVSEDFSPFDVNVSTALPSRDQLTRGGSTDTDWGVRVVVGGDGSWYDNSGGGVALLTSFDSAADTPAFVFSENLGNQTKAIAEAISHEVGHALGLEHDGQGLTEYYGGSANGSWAPIMGDSSSARLSQWSRGEYVGATTREDDLDIITGQNGFGYRTDDHGDHLTTATALSFTNDDVETYGIIETNTDVDWFSFSLSTGQVALEINAFERGANLDILAEIYDATGALVVSGDISESLGVSFTGSTDPGQYYLSVTGTGQGNPLSQGYSDYGSLGQYAITGSVA